MQNIGIYGGTFNPVHFGHLNLAIEILEAHRLDEVWFCPAQCNPHKLKTQPIAIEHRLKMLELALENVPKCRVLDFEALRPGPSYTIETLQALISQENSSSRRFSLIIGDDAIPGFFHWLQPEEIVKLVPIFVGKRGIVIPELKGNPEISSALSRGMTSTRILDISSTDVRKRLKLGLYCGHLVPAKVLDYIYANQLY